MNQNISKLPMKDRYQHLLSVMSGERFLKKQGLGNEVPFFICPYKPEEASEIDKIRRQLSKCLGQANIIVTEINLYDLTVEILKSEGDFEWILKNENTLTKEKLKEELQGMLSVEDVIVPRIAEMLIETEFDILFISGVGEVFPYIRSHNVLNNLQSTAKDKPTVMFFPGAYNQSIQTGASLDLFERLRDDKYYRAFNIFHCEA